MAAEPSRLCNSWIDRKLEIHVDAGRKIISLGAYVVKAATAKQAITLLESYKDAEDNEEAWDVFSSILREWLPLRLASTLTSPHFKRENTINIAMGLLSVGAPSPKSYASKKKQLEKKAKKFSWGHVIAEYRHFMNGTLDEPWPFFLDQAIRIDHLRARDELSFITAYGSAKSAKEQFIREIKARADLEERFEDLSPEEKTARQTNALKELEKEFRKAGMVANN